MRGTRTHVRPHTRSACACMGTHTLPAKIGMRTCHIMNAPYNEYATQGGGRRGRGPHGFPNELHQGAGELGHHAIVRAYNMWHNTYNLWHHVYEHTCTQGCNSMPTMHTCMGGAAVPHHTPCRSKKTCRASPSMARARSWGWCTRRVGLVGVSLCDRACSPHQHTYACSHTTAGVQGYVCKRACTCM